MDLHLAGKVAVVTGASKGIGLAVTRALVAEGVNVVAGARTITDELVALSDTGQVLAVALDLSQADTPAELVSRAAHFGGLDILVNNVGAVTPRTTGFLDVSDDDWHATLNLTLAGTLVESSNTAIAAFTEMLPAQQRHDYMEKFGIGKYTEVDFNGESRGELAPADEWYGRTNYTVQFGQGMSTTSVQVASIYQALANGGVRMPVTLVEGCEQPDGTMTDLPSTEGSRVVSESAADQTIAIMEQVANFSGSAARLQIPGYRTAVKSGTAQVANGNGTGYGESVVLSFAGVAPADDPQYVVVVTTGIPNKMYSGKMAATWHDVMAQVLMHFRVEPSTSPAPELPLRW